MLEIQRYLREGMSRQIAANALFADLTAKFGIKVKTHGEYPKLHLFKYDQIESPMCEKIVQECRGIILDEDDNWNVVSRVFDKFFNLGEGHAAQIDWKTGRVLEKLDGSLCVLYSYGSTTKQRTWSVATSGSPDASGDVGDHGFTFEQLFWRTFDTKGYELPADDLHNISFAFELTSKYNRVVVRQGEPNLRLIGARDRLSGSEIDPRKFAHLFEVVEHHDISTVEDVIATFEKLDPIEHEGFVIVDDQFNRVKIKHPGYVALHHLKEGFGKKRILEVIRVGEKSEFLTYFPEWTEVYDEVKLKYDELLLHLETSYDIIKHVESQKEFAIEAMKTRCSGALFQHRKMNKTFKQILAEMTINSLVQILGLKEEIVDISQA